MAELNPTESAEIVETVIPTEVTPAEQPKSDNAELLRMKAALDKATKEAADYKRQFRARQSEEEAKAQEEAESRAAMAAENGELRKRFAVADHAKRVISFAEDEAIANSIADSLYGASDADAVIDAMSKAWAAKEKKLRLEFGKIPAPASGDSSQSITKEQLGAMSYKERAEFMAKHPDIYEKMKI